MAHQGSKVGDKWVDIIHMLDCRNGVGGWGVGVTSEIVKEVFPTLLKTVFLESQPD